jgi:hypothetical protein
MSQTVDMMKDLKVRLPVHYHMKLQTLKILKGKNMSASLCEALDLYFQERGIPLPGGTSAGFDLHEVPVAE